MVLNKQSAADTLQQLAEVIACQAINVCRRRLLRQEDLLSNLNVLTPKRNKTHEAHPAGNITEPGVGGGDIWRLFEQKTTQCCDGFTRG